MAEFNEDEDEVEVEAISEDHDLKEQAKTLLADLARSTLPQAMYEVAFRIVGRLKNLTKENPRQFINEVKMFCENTGQNFEEIWPEVKSGWKRRKFGDKESPFTEAAARASDRPYVPKVCDTIGYGKLVSIAYHLSVVNAENGKNRFDLPQPKISQTIGVSQSTVSNLIRDAIENNLLECVDRKYCPGKKGMSYRFIGPPQHVTSSFADTAE